MRALPRIDLPLTALGVVCGLASAVLTLAIASGSTLSLFLFLFAPLPVMLGGLGWGPRTAVLAGAVGTLVLGLAAGWVGARGYALSIALPGWWLSFLALRPRRTIDADAPARWCTPGTLVLWAAGLGAALVIVTIPTFGLSAAAYRAGISHAFETFLRRQTATPADTPLVLPSGADAHTLISVLAIILPPVGAASWMAVTLVNLWLAARIARSSGHLPRPWPAIQALTLPRAALAVLAVALAASLAPGLAGLVGQVVTATLFIAFALVGLAVIHAGTRGFKGRVFLLIGLYLMLAIQAWTALLLAVLGVVDQFIGLRRRLANPPQPPNNR
jgi:hypothetical protein